MNIDSLVEGLLGFAQDDWIGLWVICSDIEEELGFEDSERNLELTLVVVRELLKHGLIAGDSPAQGSGIRFNPWPHQGPDVIADFIRREWARRGGLPSWGDPPWFAHLRHCEPSHAAC